METGKIKTLIAEDDYMSRQLLKGMLEQFEDIQVIGEAANGLELMQLAKTLKPQVIFIDIDMPEVNGMSAAQEILAKDANIQIIFVTGHADYAVEAFEISSLDYILKPFELERIGKTVARIKAKISQLNTDITKLARILKGPEKLFVKSDHELHFIEADNIFFIERDKNKRKSIIYTTNNKYETWESLNELESRLDQTYFFRSHKSYLINLRKIEKIVPWGELSFLIRFTGSNLDAFMSRNKVQILYEILNIQS